ncbi:MAG: sugar phosphate isomerase/epimerase [Anaerolineae bacterium]|nr:sugar phosphate isomerase/epimerase [Anaerolineae bacterium]
MTLSLGRNERVMWLANVRSVPYRERIEAAAHAGFGCISTSPRDYEKTRAEGLSDADIRAIAADNGVRLSYLDPFASWVPEAISPDEDPAIVPYLDTTPDEMFRIAEALRVDRLHFVGAYKLGRYSTAELTDYFGKMCDRAAQSGLKCVIEGIAMWALCRLDEAWAIVRDAGRPNTGIIFDTWHYTRVGRTDHIFSEIPKGAFDTIQIADGTLTCPPGRTLEQDCLYHRLPIGEGEIPNLEILRLLHKYGHIESAGPEIFSAVNDGIGTGKGINARIMPGFEAILKQL